MNRHEFNEWLDHHAARFLGLPVFLAKHTGGDGMPTKEQVLRAWENTLSHLTLDEALRASNELYALPEANQPRGFDRHPVVVRELAMNKRRSQPDRGKRRKIVDGQEVFDCLLCRDTGMVIVVHPKTVNNIIAGDGPAMIQDPQKHPFYTGAVGCDCKHSIRSQWGGRIYDEYRFCATTNDWGAYSIGDMVAHVDQWLATRRPANYEPAFDQPAGAF